ncbi:hypothetical protein M0802_001523 [Mischocyttarus mexicanus]|nr:hypothetical protein M0802_001523 [Mischocyttarus mexicanus]
MLQEQRRKRNGTKWTEKLWTNPIIPLYNRINQILCTSQKGLEWKGKEKKKKKRKRKKGSRKERSHGRYSKGRVAYDEGPEGS